jgi:hypothetical protein
MCELEKLDYLDLKKNLFQETKISLIAICITGSATCYQIREIA